MSPPLQEGLCVLEGRHFRRGWAGDLIRDQSHGAVVQQFHLHVRAELPRAYEWAVRATPHDLASGLNVQRSGPHSKTFEQAGNTDPTTSG
jgi:hypothetical protein